MRALFVKLSFLTFICLTSCTEPKDLIYDTTTSVKTPSKECDENLFIRKNENLVMKHRADKFAAKLIDLGNTELGTEKIKVSNLVFFIQNIGLPYTGLSAKVYFLRHLTALCCYLSKFQ